VSDTSEPTSELDDALRLWNSRNALFETFTTNALPPFEASADDLVRVTVDGHCQLQAVSLYGVQLDPDIKPRLEAAIVQAVNDGLRQVVLRYGDHLTKAVRQNPPST